MKWVQKSIGRHTSHVQIHRSVRPPIFYFRNQGCRRPCQHMHRIASGYSLDPVDGVILGKCINANQNVRLTMIK